MAEALRLQRAAADQLTCAMDAVAAVQGGAPAISVIAALELPEQYRLCPMCSYVFVLWLGFQLRSETLPLRRAWGGKWSTRLRGEPAARNAVEEAGRKALRSALGAVPQPALVAVTVWPRLQARCASRIGRGPKVAPSLCPSISKSCHIPNLTSNLWAREGRYGSSDDQD